MRRTVKSALILRSLLTKACRRRGPASPPLLQKSSLMYTCRRQTVKSRLFDLCPNCTATDAGFDRCCAGQANMLVGRACPERDPARPRCVAAAIAAETDAALAAAGALRAGDAERATAGDAEEVAAVLALVEAGIDFTDQEDVVAIARPQLERLVHAVLARIRARCAVSAGSEHAARAARVVLAGPLAAVPTRT